MCNFSTCSFSLSECHFKAANNGNKSLKEFRVKVIVWSHLNTAVRLRMNYKKTVSNKCVTNMEQMFILKRTF